MTTLLDEFNRLHAEITDYGEKCIVEFNVWVIPYVQVKALAIFIWIMQVFSILKRESYHYYRRTPVLKQSVKQAVVLYNGLKRRFVNYKIEPVESHWVNVSGLSNIDGCEFLYRENYDFLDNDECEFYDSDSVLKLYYIYNTDETASNNLFTLKLDDIYVYRVIPNKEKIDNMVYNVKSQCRFLTIDYRHPRMQNVIHLNIPEGAYYVDNELFSSAFILRCLSHQPLPYVFGPDYKLTIIDTDVNIVDFKWTDYCVMTERGYKMVKV